MENYLAIYTKPKIIGFKNSENHNITLQPGEKVAIFCGLAYPKQFERILKNFNIVLKHFLQDHEKFSSNDLRQFSKKAEKLGSKYILCTEKDFVKFNKSLQKDFSILYVDIDIEILKGQEILEKLIEKIVIKVNN